MEITLLVTLVIYLQTFITINFAKLKTQKLMKKEIDIMK